MRHFNNGLQEAGAYNRSSLAMQLSDATAAVVPPPMPLLMPRRQPAVEVAAPAIFRGLDVAVERDRASSATSFVIHFLLIVGLLRLGMMHTNILQPQNITVTPLHFTLYDPPPMIVPTPKISSGGGGGGAHELIEPTKGHLPPVVKMPVLAPQILRIDNPKLAVEPTMQVKMPENTTLPNIGVSQSPQVAMASQGSGSNSGFGFGAGGGIGVGHGNGVGPGTGGGYGGGIMSVGGGVSAPQVIHSVEPQFTEAARQANYQGTVSIQLIVDSQGNPQDVRVVRHLDMGLDQKAVEAVKQYRFKPAMYQGHAVSVQMVVEVDFRLH